MWKRLMQQSYILCSVGIVIYQVTTVVTDRVMCYVNNYRVM